MLTSISGQKTDVLVKSFYQTARGRKLTAMESLPLIHALLLYNSSSFLSENQKDRLAGELFLGTITTVCHYNYRMPFRWLKYILLSRLPVSQVCLIRDQHVRVQTKYLYKNGLFFGESGSAMRLGVVPLGSYILLIHLRSSSQTLSLMFLRGIFDTFPFRILIGYGRHPRPRNGLTHWLNLDGRPGPLMMECTA